MTTTAGKAFFLILLVSSPFPYHTTAHPYDCFNHAPHFSPSTQANQTGCENFLPPRFHAFDIVSSCSRSLAPASPLCRAPRTTIARVGDFMIST